MKLWQRVIGGKTVRGDRVEKVEFLDDAGKSVRIIQRVGFDFAYNTTDILTGKVIFSGRPGDRIVGYETPVYEAFDGTSPRGIIQIAGEAAGSADAIQTWDLTNADNFYDDSQDLEIIRIPAGAVLGGEIIYFEKPGDVILIVDNDAEGDPNDPTPMEVGSAGAYLYVIRA